MWQPPIHVIDRQEDATSRQIGVHAFDLTTSHNSGMVQGAANKIKFFKRQMYGRANLDLLRKHILLAT